MTLRERITLTQRELLADQRGWFVKTLDGSEAGLPNRVGEVYLTMATPGQARANHYHPVTDEWFTVVAGKARFIVADPLSGERLELELDAANPVTVHVPAGLAHVFINPPGSAAELIVVAYAANPYDPADTVPFPLWP